MPARCQIDHKKLAQLCHKHGISKLSLFGSVLRSDFDPTHSDVDVLVEFFPEIDRQLTYFKLARVQLDLEEVIGFPIDLALTNSLDPKIRQHILSSAETEYVAA